MIQFGDLTGQSVGLFDLITYLRIQVFLNTGQLPAEFSHEVSQTGAFLENHVS